MSPYKTDFCRCWWTMHRICSALLGDDPRLWPTITNVYKSRSTEAMICTVYRYENIYPYTRAIIELDQYCYHCGTNVHRGYGIILYTTPNLSTIPRYICIGCMDKNHGAHTYILTWGAEDGEELFGKITDIDRRSGRLLEVLDELYNCICLRNLNRIGTLGLSIHERAQLPPEFESLMRMARKL